MDEIYLKQMELNAQGRCAQCQRKGDEMITCDRCDEFRYCSIQCLVDDSESHELLCNLVGIRKGILYVRTEQEAERYAKIMEKAKLLNEDGSERIRRLSPDDFGRSNIQVEGTQSSAANKSKSSRAHKVKAGPDQRIKVEKESFEEEDGRQRKGEQTLNEIMRGNFGGPAKVDSRVLSGESFGSGWWKAGKRDQRETKTSSSLAASATKTGADSHARRKFTEYLDATDASDELVVEESPEDTEQQAKASRTTDWQLVTYDPGRAGEPGGGAKKSQRSTTKGKCLFCKKEGFVLQCSRCRRASYCDSTCQKSHFPRHKDICKRTKRFDQALEKVPSSIKMAKQVVTGSFKPSPFLEDLIDEFTYMMLGSSLGTSIMLEMVGRYFHPFRHGVKVKDLLGQETFILFYDDTDIYHHVTSLPWPMTVLPIPLSQCIQPGNFIFLLEAHWHRFLDGTRGIRIDDLDNVHFILNNLS